MRHTKGAKWLIWLGWTLGVSLLVFTAITSTEHHKTLRQDKSQYHRLAEALLEGKTSLNLPIPKGLLSLSDPYKASDTQKYIDPSEKAPLWDTSYYKGKIYLYYGIVPAAIMFMPYEALTGVHMDMRLALLLLSILASAASIICLNINFPSTRWGNFLCGLVITVSPGYAYLMRRPEMYEIAIVGASAFGLMGLAYLTKSFKNRPTKNLTLGASLWALSIGCRPTTLISAGAPLIALLSRLKVGDKKSPIFALLAILFVATALALYNYSRFESPLNFGARNVLTGLNSGPDSPPIHNVPIIKENLKIYLLQTPHWDWEFPYAHPTPGWHGKHDQKIGELTSGLLATAPIAILAIFGVFYAFKPNPTKTWWAMVSAIWLPLLLLTSAATLVSMRFVLEFSPAMVLAGCAVASQWIASSDKIKKYIAVTLLISSLPTPILLSLKGTYNNFENHNPKLYKRLKENFHTISDPLKDIFTQETISLTQNSSKEVLVPSISFPESELKLRHQNLGRLNQNQPEGKWTMKTMLNTKGSFFEWRFVSIGSVTLFINGEQIHRSEGGPTWTTKYLPKGTHLIEVEYYPQRLKKQLFGFYRTQKDDQRFYPIGISDKDTHWHLPR